MQKFVHCRTRAEFIEVAGRDWAKIVKVDGGYIGFKYLTDYQTWRAQR